MRSAFALAAALPLWTGGIAQAAFDPSSVDREAPLAVADKLTVTNKAVSAVQGEVESLSRPTPFTHDSIKKQIEKVQEAIHHYNRVTSLLLNTYSNPKADETVGYVVSKMPINDRQTFADAGLSLSGLAQLAETDLERWNAVNQDNPIDIIFESEKDPSYQIAIVNAGVFQNSLLISTPAASSPAPARSAPAPGMR